MSKHETEQDRLITISLLIIASVAIGLILIFARSILVPFVLAVFIAQMLSPILDYQIIRLHFPRYIAVVTTLLIVTIILTSLCIFLGQALYDIISKVGAYSDRFIDFLNTLALKLKELKVGVDLDIFIEEIQKNVPSLASNIFSNLIGVITSFALMYIFVLFILIGRNPYTIQKGIFAEIDHQVRKYLFIKTIISGLTGIFVWAVLALLGLEFASIFGLFAFLLNFIPSIGSIIAVFLPVPVAVVQFDNPWYIALVIICPAIIELVMGNIIDPKLMGKGLNLHPITVLISLAVWGLLWGIPGMFLAAPITAVIRIILMQHETLRPLGMLLAGHLPKQTEPQKTG